VEKRRNGNRTQGKERKEKHWTEKESHHIRWEKSRWNSTFGVGIIHVSACNKDVLSRYMTRQTRARVPVLASNTKFFSAVLPHPLVICHNRHLVADSCSQDELCIKGVCVGLHLRAHACVRVAGKEICPRCPIRQNSLKYII
jgi:hypothetical protein